MANINKLDEYVQIVTNTIKWKSTANVGHKLILEKIL